LKTDKNIVVVYAVCLITNLITS